jgi:hypothetical protein
LQEGQLGGRTLAAEVMHVMAERTAIRRVGPMGEDNGPTPKPPGGTGGATGKLR